MFGSTPKRSGPRVASWFWVRLERGKPFRGWLAGPVIGVDCHHLGGTRGCPAALTRGAVKCSVSHREFPPVWKGYVPLWDANGTRSFVVIMEEWWDLVSRVPLLGEVTAEKTDFHGSPIRVAPSRTLKCDPPLTSHERKAQDIRPFLLRLWKANAVRDYFADEGMPALPAMAVAVPVVTQAELGAAEFFKQRKQSSELLSTKVHPNAERNGTH